MVPNALGESKTGDCFGAGPVVDAADFGAFAEFDHDLGEVVGGADLAEFVGEEGGGVAGGPVGEEAFVEAALAGGAVAAEERGAEGDGEIGGDAVDNLFAGEFLAAVEVEGRGRGGISVGRVVAGENLLGGEVDEARAEVVGEAGEEFWQSDVESLGAGGIGGAGGGLADGGAVDDGLGEGVEDVAGERVGRREIEREVAGEAGEAAGEGAGGADDFVAAASGSLGEGPADETGGAGEEDLHRGNVRVEGGVVSSVEGADDTEVVPLSFSGRRGGG